MNQSHRGEEICAACGPIYGVPLLSSLPLDGGMRQALPSRKDLDDVRRTKINGNDRVVAGYEILLEHYYRLRSFVCCVARGDPFGEHDADTVVRPSDVVTEFAAYRFAAKKVLEGSEAPNV